MATKLQIINMALDHLDEEIAIDENDNRPAYTLASRNIDQVCKALLRLYPWNFAIAEDELTSPATRSYGWSYEYDMPADCLRLLPLRKDEEHQGYVQKYEVRKNKILTNEGEKIRIRYIQDLTADYADLTDPLFIDALALRLAHAITRKNSYVERVSSMLRQAMEEATLMDSLEGYPEDANGDYWDNARHGGTY